MTRDKAEQSAKERSKRYGVSYSIVQVRNGQWMCERTSFVQDDARGRMLYSGKPTFHFPPAEMQ